MSTNSQAWSDPVVIYNEGYNEHPDFAVDKSGTIHCVWSHSVTVDFRKIYYSQSKDNGITWTSPVDLSGNTSLVMTQPHIVVDSMSNLHVVYDYNVYEYSKTKICYIKFNGLTWSQPVFLAEDMPGASHNRLVVDHNNRVYCFWFYGRICYRILANEMWSNINQPYGGNLDVFFINSLVVDKQNNLHCIGSHHYEGQTSYDDRVIYFSMISEVWSNFVEISDTLSWESCDIGLRANGLPALVWGQWIRDTLINQTGMYFSEFLNSGLTTPMLLSTQTNEQALAVDANDQVHIIENKQISSDSFQMVHFYSRNGIWEKQVLQNNNREFYHMTLKSCSSWIYLTTNRLDNNDPYNSSILFAKHYVNTGFKEEQTDITVEIFPNPLSEKLTIKLTSAKEEEVRISISDYHGRRISCIFQGYITPGEMLFYANSTELKQSMISGQMYFVCIQLGERRYYQKILYLSNTK